MYADLKRSSRMTQRLGLVVALLLAAAAPVLAQTHPGHPQGQPHDGPTHPHIDPELHRMMHGLSGTWRGTLLAPDGSSTKLVLVAAPAVNDAQGKLTLKVASPELEDVGAAGNVVVKDRTVRWTQALWGASCTASATISKATRDAAETMKGTIACPEREMALALVKTKH